MHPAFSVIFLTTLIGVGQGLFLALYSGELYAVIEVLPPQDGRSFYGVGSLIAVGFLLAGLGASFFHLGHPERAWRSASQWRTSWLSREVIALPLFIGLVVLYGAIHFSGWNPLLFRLGDTVMVTPSLLVGALTTLSCFALFLCTSMIYACLRFLQEWYTPLTVINFVLLGGASGFTLAAAFAAFQAPGLLPFFASTAMVLTLFGYVGRHIVLIRNRRLKAKSTPQSAVGVRHTRIKQMSQGAMGGSFNTREFFHGKSVGIVQLVRWTYFTLAFFVPLGLLALASANGLLMLFGLAFVVQYAGLIGERWCFFAMARHPQNIYYQQA